LRVYGCKITTDDGEETTAGRQDWWQYLAVELKQHIWRQLDVKEIIMATTVYWEWRKTLLADQHQPWATIFQRFPSLPPTRFIAPILVAIYPLGSFLPTCLNSRCSDLWVVLVLNTTKLVGKLLGASI